MNANPFLKFAAPALLVLGLVAAAPFSAAQEERIWRPPGGGQLQGDIILYRLPNYNGPNVRVQTPVNDLGVNWRVRSIRVNSGEWRVCTETNYRGACTTVRANTPNIGLGQNFSRVQSLMLVTSPDGGNAGPSLRGMASEFFRSPSARGQRILACARGQATANCARVTAQDFCRGRGYNHVGNVALETVSRRVYLADVLCKRSAA